MRAIIALLLCLATPALAADDTECFITRGLVQTFILRGSTSVTCGTRQYQLHRCLPGYELFTADEPNGLGAYCLGPAQ